MDILALLKKDGIDVKYVASTNGGEFASACPHCGGRDRFRIWPQEGRWWCRRCDRSGDSAGYLMKFHGYRYSEACKSLGLEMKNYKTRKNAKTSIYENKKRWRPRQLSFPSDTWRKKAAAFVKWAIEKLWCDEGSEALTYLRSRGLSDTTIKDANLGFNPYDIYRNRKNWGLTEKKNDKGHQSRLWLPRGITIPVYRNGKLARVRIRRPDEDLNQGSRIGSSRYIQVSGSSSCCMVLGTGKVYVVLEAELDAHLLKQECGDLAGIIALGSANMRPDSEIEALLQENSSIIALDLDDAGGRESWNFWVKSFPLAIRRPIPGGKDAGECFQAGVNLKSWLIGVMADIRRKQFDQGQKSQQIESPRLNPKIQIRAEEEIPSLSDNRFQPSTRTELRTIPKCLGIACEYARFKTRENGCICLWCNKKDIAVINLMTCPNSHWQKDEKGYPIG